MPTATALRRRLLPACAALLAALAFAALLAAPAAAQSSTAAPAAPSAPAANGEAVAIFAGGCFWCVESDFDAVPGVTATVSGYTGGDLANPDYERVSAGGTGHREAVRITFDPALVSYATLLDIFWHSVDPTDGGGQFCDRGHGYTTAVYATDEAQRAAAEASKAALAASGALASPIVTEIAPAGPFWPAEAYHQDYHQKSAVSYKFYRWRCGRDARLGALWGKDAHRGNGKG